MGFLGLPRVLCLKFGVPFTTQTVVLLSKENLEGPRVSEKMPKPVNDSRKRARGRETVCKSNPWCRSFSSQQSHIAKWGWRLDTGERYSGYEDLYITILLPREEFLNQEFTSHSKSGACGLNLESAPQTRIFQLNHATRDSKTRSLDKRTKRGASIRSEM